MWHCFPPCLIPPAASSGAFPPRQPLEYSRLLPGGAARRHGYLSQEREGLSQAGPDLQSSALWGRAAPHHPPCGPGAAATAASLQRAAAGRRSNWTSPRRELLLNKHDASSSSSPKPLLALPLATSLREGLQPPENPVLTSGLGRGWL